MRENGGYIQFQIDNGIFEIEAFVLHAEVVEAYDEPIGKRRLYPIPN